MVVTLGQQYDVGEKPTVILYTRINHHAGTPNKTSMAINVSVKYNGRLLPDIILLTRCYYYHRETRLNTMKRFCLCSL